jgi:hypothetical protein
MFVPDHQLCCRNINVVVACCHMSDDPDDELLVVNPLVQVHQESHSQLGLPCPVLKGSFSNASSS